MTLSFSAAFCDNGNSLGCIIERIALVLLNNGFVKTVKQLPSDRMQAFSNLSRHATNKKRFVIGLWAKPTLVITGSALGGLTGVLGFAFSGPVNPSGLRSFRFLSAGDSDAGSSICINRQVSAPVKWRFSVRRFSQTQARKLPVKYTGSQN